LIFTFLGEAGVAGLADILCDVGLRPGFDVEELPLELDGDGWSAGALPFAKPKV